MQKRIPLALCVLASAAGAAEAQVCTVAEGARTLPAEVRETSGLARGRTNTAVFWTHNDSGNEAALYALGADGTIKSRVLLRGLSLADWEDIEGGACGDKNCLYVADIGDNAGRRSHVSIYEVIEPSAEASETTASRVLHARYADGPQDAEALFRLPSGDIYIVTKGRQRSIKLYKLKTTDAQGAGMLELIREVAPRPETETGRVTAATSSPDGKWVAIRSYSTLYIYRTPELLSDGAPAITHSLVSLNEKQGESVTLDDDGMVWLTSEAERQRDLPTITALRCVLPN